jgi:pimeloyl-ACP methyl ester carboxylesterase
MGSLIGWRIPVYAPDRFISLILGGAGYPIQGKVSMDNPVVATINNGLQMALKEAPDRPMEFFIKAIEKTMGAYPPERRDQMLAHDAHALIASIQGMAQGKVPKAEEVLPDVNLPCLIFIGELDPSLPEAEESASLIPNATFLSLQGLGHLEAMARKDLVLQAVKKFLAEVNKK